MKKHSIVFDIILEVTTAITKKSIMDNLIYHIIMKILCSYLLYHFLLEEIELYILSVVTDIPMVSVEMCIYVVYNSFAVSLLKENGPIEKCKEIRSYKTIFAENFENSKFSNRCRCFYRNWTGFYIFAYLHIHNSF